MAGLLSGLFSTKWTLNNLMNVDYGRQQKSQGCQAYVIDAWPEIKKEGIIDKFKNLFLRNRSSMTVLYIIFKFQVISETGHTYDVFIRTQYDPKSVLYMNNTVQIYCSCPDFKFHSAFTLNQHNSLFLTDRTRLNLGAAVTNSPKKKPNTVLCKHAYAAVMNLANNYRHLMNSYV